MKSKIKRSILLLSMFLLAGSSLFAQELSIEVNVPFPFTVMEKSFPAGTYMIRETDTMGSGVYTIRSKDGKLSEDFQTEPVQRKNPPQKAMLVFNEVGKEHFLSQFFNPGEETGRQLAKSKAEQKAESSNHASSQKIVEGKGHHPY